MNLLEAKIHDLETRVDQLETERRRAHSAAADVHLIHADLGLASMLTLLEHAEKGFAADERGAIAEALAVARTSIQEVWNSALLELVRIRVRERLVPGEPEPEDNPEPPSGATAVVEESELEALVGPRASRE